MQLTLRALLILLAAPLWLALSLFLPWLMIGAALWALLALALLLADWRLAPAKAAWRIVRRHDNRLSLAADNRIELQITLGDALRPTPIWLRDSPPPSFELPEHARILSGAVAPNGTTTLFYTVYPPRRGDYHFADIHLRWQSPLGLLRRQARFAAQAAVKVYPNLADVRKYDLLLRGNRLWELGLRNARLFGSGSEFERLRDYQPDDDFRRINWKATARRNSPITIEFETERSQNIVALLDTGRMMRSPVGDVAKIDYAINAVLLLTYVATRKGDKVGLLSFADTVQNWLAPRSGKAQFHRMLELLYRVQSQSVEPDYNAAFGYFAARQPKRTLVIVFTDLTGSLSGATLVAQMSRLRRRHLALLVVLRDPTVQQMARQAVSDSATLYQRTVAEQLLEERRLTLEQLQHQGVLTLDVAADELSVAVINRYLEIKARALL
jgi:uncharacterized protein (DUF58 family)